MCWTNTLCVCVEDITEQEAESKFTTVPLGGMSVQCIVVTQRIQHTLKTLLSCFFLEVFGFHSLSFSLCFYPVCSYFLAHKQKRTSKLFIFSVFWPNSSIGYASYVLFMQNAHVQTIPQLCSYKFTIPRIPLLLHSLLRAQPLHAETWAWRQCCILTSRVRQPRRERASNQAH